MFKNKEVKQIEEKLKCCVCGEELNSNELYEFNGEFYCGQCLDDVTVLCDCCGDRIRRDSAISDSNYTLCSNCFDEEYNYCESCGAIIANEDAYYLDDYEEYPYCQHCYNRETSHRYIHDYSYKLAITVNLPKFGKQIYSRLQL